MRQQDRCPDHVPPPGRLFGLRRLGRAERLDEVQRPAFRERIGLGRQIGEDRIDCGVDLLVDGFGGSEEFRDDPVGSRANLPVRSAEPVSGAPNLRELTVRPSSDQKTTKKFS
jgi:hypothetical protein